MKRSEKAQKVVDGFQESVKLRQMLLSLAGCAHCGLCNDSCHYYLATGDPEMTPAAKSDKIRRLYKYHNDRLGRIFPWWVGGETLKTDEDLEELKDIVYGSCTMCRRCTFNCPFGIDTALLMRTARGLITAQGVAPEGILSVMKDQWEIGNQMGVTPKDYIETLEWLEEEVQDELPDFKVPIDKEGADIVYVINPREVKYAPQSLMAAFKIFHLAGENWTMPSQGWDNTNFGLFSGDNKLGAHMGNLAFNQAKKLGVKKMVISECGHGFRSTKWESPNWAKANPLPFEIESILETMVRYVNQGRIVLDRTRNKEPVTYHDPCNLSRSAGITEEPRFLLKRSCMDFREMYPNRQDSFCCTGGGGAMSMSEYASKRIEVGRIKADQIRATGAKHVATACHNCEDGLSDLVKHYKLGVTVKNVCEFVADACALPEEKRKLVSMPIADIAKGKKILVIDDQPDVVQYLEAFLKDQGFSVVIAMNGAQGLAKAKQERPDLITLDITMPGKSGIEVFTALRKDPDTKDIPVFIITGVMNFRQLMYYREVMPPDAYMEKPIDTEALLLNLRRLLDERKHGSKPADTANMTAV
ncbi:MAG: response regulator [Deltaproteobacteria bacterium]|nr:response regulator [Deltaproteobacteria bacterium]